MFLGVVFIPWYFLLFFIAFFISLFTMPFEIAFLGLFSDSIIFASAPNLFTLGFLVMISAAEIIKSLINAETKLGKIIIFLFSLAAFCFIYFYLFII